MFTFFKKKIIFFSILIVFFITISFCYKFCFTKPVKNYNSLEYEKIIDAINANKPESLNQAELFIIKNNNIYGTLTSMFLAKKYISQNKLREAFIQLNNSLQYTTEENLKNILKIRMTKIKIQKKEQDNAMNIVKSIQNTHWSNIIENLKGDILIHKNNKKLAIKSWKKSLNLENSHAFKEIINMKINELKQN